MAHHDKEAAIKGVYRGLVLLGVLTLIEVAISLFGKGHLGWDPANTFQMTLPFTDFTFSPILGLVALGLIGFSLYKAYFIIYEFMHMGHEVKALRMTVLMPTILLVWAIIAFFQEGGSYKERRNQILEKNKVEMAAPAGMELKEKETKKLH